jgi:hypothetical protein
MRFAEQPVSRFLGSRAAVDRRDSLYHWITSGGDERLKFDRATGLNAYGCSAVPRPQELTFSSSTATTISSRAFSQAEVILELLSGSHKCNGGDTYEQLTEQLRQDLKAILDLSTGVEVILSPSGTDCVLHALALARDILKRPVASIILAADETGSGVGLAAAGRHFGNFTCCGREVVKGGPVADLATPFRSVTILARERNGQARKNFDVDNECLRKVGALVAAGFGAIVHVMDQSKTGLRYPSDAGLLELIDRYGQSIQIVVDACQTRLSRNRLNWYIEHGCLVMITGSKFFTGPAFSGALIVPEPVAMRIATIKSVPMGLTDYTSRYDWPIVWPRIRSSLPTRMNTGQLLRWFAAIEEMRAYFAVPELARKIALQELGSIVLRAIVQLPDLNLLKTNVAAANRRDAPDEFDNQTIFSFLVCRHSKPLSYDDSKLLFRAMNVDLSSSFRASRVPAQADLASELCHIGQPVAIADGAGGYAGALRISLDARMISQCWRRSEEFTIAENTQRVFNQLKIVLQKLLFLVDHLDVIQSNFLQASVNRM